MPDSEMRNPCKTYPDDPCYGCKRNIMDKACTIFYVMEYDQDKCPCIKCIVKPMCTKLCTLLQEFVDAEMLKGGII